MQPVKDIKEKVGKETTSKVKLGRFYPTYEVNVTHS